MLPADYRWIESDHGSALHLRYACVATVSATGEVRIHWYSEIRARAASREQGKRHVERWLAGKGQPPGKQARQIVADRRAGRAPRPLPALPPAQTMRQVIRMPDPPDEWAMLPAQRDW